MYCCLQENVRRWAVLCLLPLLFQAALKGNGYAQEPVLTRIAFGSCLKQDQPQPIWSAVADMQPQLFVLLGDNIYGDTNDMDVLKAKYQMLNDQPGFQKLRSLCSVTGTWDDHDYGANDAGVEYAMKKESQALFLDFFQVDASDPRRTREGVYSAQVYGPPGKRVQLILLDTRYFRSPLQKGFDKREPGEGYRGVYVPHRSADVTVLGEAQWRWLEQQLREPAEVRLIGSSIQVLSDLHGWEMWGNFPKDRERLFSLIRQTNAHGVILLSGDRHLAEIAAMRADDPMSPGYPLYEATSSSLNAPSGNFTKAGTRFANEINPYRIGLTYFDTNFGALQIDWDAPDPILTLQVRDEKGGVVLQQRLKLSQLQSH